MESGKARHRVPRSVPLERAAPAPAAAYRPLARAAIRARAPCLPIGGSAKPRHCREIRTASLPMGRACLHHPTAGKRLALPRLSFPLQVSGSHAATNRALAIPGRSRAGRRASGVRRTGRWRQMSKGRASHALGSNRDGADYGHDFFKRSLRMHTWGTTIRCQGRSRASEAGHLREFGFQPSFEASGLMIDRFARFFSSVPRADVSG